jgi:urease accessory protein
MKTVNKLIPQGQGLSAVLIKRGTRVELDWDTRQKSRFEALDSAGDALGVFLPRGAVVRGGDVLVTEDGALVSVVAKPQPVLTVRAGQGSPLALLRAAYHLGNRHVALEVHSDRLQLEPDHVLADMLRQMHLEVVEQLAPFEPEGGAYASAADAHGHGHGHDHGHGHGDAHQHAHQHAHDHAPDPVLMRSPAPQAPHSGDHGHNPSGHVHGPNCKHDH